MKRVTGIGGRGHVADPVVVGTEAATEEVARLSMLAPGRATVDTHSKRDTVRIGWDRDGETPRSADARGDGSGVGESEAVVTTKGTKEHEEERRECRAFLYSFVFLRAPFVVESGITLHRASMMRQILTPHGYTVCDVEVRGCLHLKSAATAVAVRSTHRCSGTISPSSSAREMNSSGGIVPSSAALLTRPEPWAPR